MQYIIKYVLYIIKYDILYNYNHINYINLLSTQSRSAGIIFFIARFSW